MGLSLGKHIFEYEVNDSFFEDLEYSLVQKGNLKVHLELEKKGTMMLATFKIIGVVCTECDRCTAPLELNIAGEYRLIYKFGLEDSDDENLIVLHPDEYQINVKDPIYELIIISLPARKIHKQGECDEAMWELIKEYSVNLEEDDDSEFDDDRDDEDGEDDDDEDGGESPWTILRNLN